MKKDKSESSASRKVLLIKSIPRGLTIILLLSWLILFLKYGIENYFTAGIMIGIIIFLTSAIAWKNTPIGGGIFIIVASLYLAIIINIDVPGIVALGSLPLFIIGALFIIEHLYLEKKESETEEEDDF
jgi:hypothetical protein